MFKKPKFAVVPRFVWETQMAGHDAVQRDTDRAVMLYEAVFLCVVSGRWPAECWHVEIRDIMRRFLDYPPEVIR